MNILLLSELVDKYGSRIKGDKKIDQLNNYTASNLTTDDKVHMQRQGVSRYNNYGRVYMGEDDETTDGVKEPEENNPVPKPKGKSKVKPKTPPPWGKPKEHQRGLKVEAKIKMDSLIEDIFTKKDFDKEFVNRRIGDLNSSEIGDLNSIRDTNPILIRKVAALKDIIEKNNASGEEKAVILNHLLSTDLTDIPQNHREILKRKLS